MELFVGTYTKGTDSKGIYAVRFNEENNTLTAAGTADICNPSFLAVRNDSLYAVSEVDVQAKMVRFGIKKDLKLMPEREYFFPGSGSCHLTVTENGELAFVANYVSGSFLSIDISEGAKPGEEVKSYEFSGSGPNSERQKSSHVHSVNISPNGKHLIVADLGTDRMMVYDILKEQRMLVENKINKYVKAGPGEGPRHICFHPKAKKLYVVTELLNKVISFSYEPETGRILKEKEFSILPESFKGDSLSADIHISNDARFLYVSNRGWDGITAFKVEEDGSLELSSRYEGFGKTPRNFAISKDGKYFVIAYQDSDTVVVAKRDEKTGEVKQPITQIVIPSPVCVIEK